MRTKEHAKRLKAALDVALHGEVVAKNNQALRHSWKDVIGAFESEDERATWWGLMLLEAQRELEGSVGDFDIFDDDERTRRIAASR